jgi:hypothetical protein
LSTRERTRRALSLSAWSRGPTGRRRAPAQAAIAERGGNTRSGPSLPKGSAGWHTSGCCAR